MVVLLLSLIAVCMLAAGAAILAMHLATLLGSVRGEHGALLVSEPASSESSRPSTPLPHQPRQI
eukprot:4570086-Pyramimonas_sp.AAC.2